VDQKLSPGHISVSDVQEQDCLMENQPPENWHLPLQGIYCAISDGRIMRGSLVEQMYRMRWLGVRLITNTTRAHVLARRRPHDTVYLLAEDDRCARAEHPDLEPNPLSTVIRRWSGQRIDVLWGQSHIEVERVLKACRSDLLPVYIAIETGQADSHDDAFSERFQKTHLATSFTDSPSIRQYRIRRTHRARGGRQRTTASDAEQKLDQPQTSVGAEKSVLNLASWAKHEKLRRLEQRSIIERLGLRR